jgi:hypothetical protein
MSHSAFGSPCAAAIPALGNTAHTTAATASATTLRRDLRQGCDFRPPTAIVQISAPLNVP